MGIGRWVFDKDKKTGEFTTLAEGQFNAKGYRDGICREIYNTGYFYLGHWDEGVQIPPPDADR